MFTGIIETCGTVRDLIPVATGAKLVVGAPFAGALEIGESVAVNGVCLTVTERDEATMSFDLLAETLAVTNLGDLTPGARVNLERALAANARLSGHFVQGHIDTTGTVLAWEPVGQDHRLEISLPPDFERYLIRKGSICIDGISLTVADLDAGSFTVWIIPHTASVTNLGTGQVGRRVNLEFDMLAKYVERLLGSR
ncbi:MAG TPA: riboflavin synthase [Verrucomicrobiales bacterium]|nr:riboflavin synthase [Verrucomicrobiales bacterium]